MNNKFDTIVIGLGATGSAALYQLAKRGNRVLGIDQFSPPHAYGSSHGDTRITRQAIGEGEQYTPLSLRSYELWREMERETGRNLLTITGGIIISNENQKGDNFFRNTLIAAKKYNITHEILDPQELRTRFPQFIIQDGDVGYFEYNAGFLRAEECVGAQLALAEKHGAKINRNERVVSFLENNDGVTVKTNLGEYSADRLIVSAGPWLSQLLEEKYRGIFTMHRQVMYWFNIDGPVEKFLPEKFPIFVWHLNGFPALDGPGGGIKIACADDEPISSVDEINRHVSEEEKQFVYDTYIAPNIRGLSSRCIRAVPCLYTLTPDHDFVIDRHPEYPSIILASPCSGHGFKHSAAIGEVLAELVTDGKSTIDISSFTLGRFL